jgi:hypothetical protein
VPASAMQSWCAPTTDEFMVESSRRRTRTEARQRRVRQPAWRVGRWWISRHFHKCLWISGLGPPDLEDGPSFGRRGQSIGVARRSISRQCTESRSFSRIRRRTSLLVFLSCVGPHPRISERNRDHLDSGFHRGAPMHFPTIRARGRPRCDHPQLASMSVRHSPAHGEGDPRNRWRWAI